MSDLDFNTLQRAAEVSASRFHKRLYHVRILERCDLINCAWLGLLEKKEIYLENGVINFGLALSVASSYIYNNLRRSYDGMSIIFEKLSQVAAVDSITVTQEKPRQWAADKLDIDLEFYNNVLRAVDAPLHLDFDELPMLRVYELSQSKTEIELANAEINAALSKLTTVEVHVVTAIYLHGLDQSEAAKMLGLKIDAVSYLRSKALKNLRNHFGRNKATHPTR